MTLEHILINLKRELIRTFAVVDEWLDRESPLHHYRPASGGWNVNEVLEHVMLTNHYLLILIEKGKEKALKKYEALSVPLVMPDNYTLANAEMQEIAQPNAFEWQRPEHHQPTGERTVAEIRNEIRDQLYHCLLTVDVMQNGEGTLHQTMMSVNNLGKLDVYQYIYFLALHAQRHLQQMKKIEEEFNASVVTSEAAV